MRRFYIVLIIALFFQNIYSINYEYENTINSSDSGKVLYFQFQHIETIWDNNINGICTLGNKRNDSLEIMTKRPLSYDWFYRVYHHGFFTGTGSDSIKLQVKLYSYTTPRESEPPIITNIDTIWNGGIYYAGESAFFDFKIRAGNFHRIVLKPIIGNGTEVIPCKFSLVKYRKMALPTFKWSDLK